MKILKMSSEIHCPKCGCTRVESSTYADYCADCGYVFWNYIGNCPGD